MTTGLTLLVLRFAFLAVLWLFVFVIVFALRSDLFGQRVRTIPTDPKGAPSGPTTPTIPAGGCRAGWWCRRVHRAHRAGPLVRLAADRHRRRHAARHHRGRA